MSDTKQLFDSVTALFKFGDGDLSENAGSPGQHNLKPDMVEHACNPSTWKVEAEELDVQSHIAS